MLMLTRRSGEEILIDTPLGTIRIKTRQRGDKTSLAIDAPKEIKILRAELAAKETPKDHAA